MKRFLFVTAALLVMSVSFCFGQSKEDIKASIDRCAKLEKLCSKQPKQTGVADVDTYVQGVYNAAISSAASSALLQDLYYRQIGETKDGVTDVTIKKPTVEELVALGTTLTAEGVSIAEAGKGAEAAIKAFSTNKNPMKVAKIASALAFTKDAYPVLLEELKAKVGIKKTIADYGVKEEDFLATLDEMTEAAFDDQCTGANPRYPLMSEMKAMYLKAYYGK